MSEEDRLKLENELLLTKSKAQMINLYLDLQQKVEQLEKELQITANNCKQLENIINEAIGFTNSHFKEMVADEEAQALLNILNKGDNNGK